MDRIERILKDIESIDRPGRKVIMIDGPCGTGKTTLALELSKHIECSIVHTDDFFLPFEKRTRERLSIPGGNLDSERMIHDVFERLGEREFSYHPFDCSTGRISRRSVLIDKPVVIVEGVYSMLPCFWPYLDKCYILKEDLDVRLRRIREREGEEKYKVFLEKWIPLENAYFDYYNFQDIWMI